MSEKKQPVDLGLLEEDDEFEEFPAEGRLENGEAEKRRGRTNAGLSQRLVWVCASLVWVRRGLKASQSKLLAFQRWNYSSYHPQPIQLDGIRGSRSRDPFFQSRPPSHVSCLVPREELPLPRGILKEVPGVVDGGPASLSLVREEVKTFRGAKESRVLSETEA